MDVSRCYIHVSGKKLLEKKHVPAWLLKCAKLAKLAVAVDWGAGAAKMSEPRSLKRSNCFFSCCCTWERPTTGDWNHILTIKSFWSVQVHFCNTISNSPRLKHSFKDYIIFYLYSWILLIFSTSIPKFSLNSKCKVKGKDILYYNSCYTF